MTADGVEKRMRGKSGLVALELRRHAPFTAVGAVTGIAIMVAIAAGRVPRSVSEALFWTLHPLHVLLSALVTAALYRKHTVRAPLSTIVVGFVGSLGIATLSDSLIPFLGEWLLDMPNRGIHVGFIEKWWLVNPLAAAGIALAFVRPTTLLPHAGHVLLSTWASLFHMSMALGTGLSVSAAAVVVVFLFLAVWVPCCTSDIVLPMIFVARRFN